MVAVDVQLVPRIEADRRLIEPFGVIEVAVAAEEMQVPLGRAPHLACRSRAQFRKPLPQSKTMS